MAVAPVVLLTNPHRPVDFKESAVVKALNASGNLNVEVKEDGAQLNMVVAHQGGDTKVHFLSREGKAFNGLKALGESLSVNELWNKFFNPHLDAGLFRENNGFLLQAEVLTFNADGTQRTCAEISGDLLRGEAIPLNRMEIVAFDLIPLDVVFSGKEYEVFQELRSMHMRIQVEAIKARFPQINIRPVEVVQVFSLEALMAVYEKFRLLGKEGGVAKDPLCYWKRGKRTGQWKVKPDDECDGVVTGLIWGTPGLANEGKVIGFTVLTEHGVEVDCTGLKEDLKDEYTAKVEALIPLNTMSPHEWDAYHDEYPNGNAHYLWDMGNTDINPFDQWTCKITYMERLASGSYRHPNFDCFRGITDPLLKE